MPGPNVLTFDGNFGGRMVQKTILLSSVLFLVPDVACDMMCVVL